MNTASYDSVRKGVIFLGCAAFGCISSLSVYGFVVETIPYLKLNDVNVFNSIFYVTYSAAIVSFCIAALYGLNRTSASVICGISFFALGLFYQLDRDVCQFDWAVEVPRCTDALSSAAQAQIQIREGGSS